MKKLTGNEIIKMYIDYFKSLGHTEIESASLIPYNDKSLLWINAGVTPLKKFLDGSEVPVSRRLVSVQKCIRTGDIESVGRTARHHTFFQMLGNFSIGDYFRKEALEYAYTLLTSPKYFDIDKDKLYITVYPDDIEAYNKWIELGIDESHIVKLESNYWEIGPGPSGPDSEIFYDRGPKYDPNNLGIELLEKEIENDRYIEIWNNVFSQYNAKEGVPRSEYKELPSKNIDTGMGVERMACIMQEVETNYDTDMFLPIMKEIEKITGIKYNGQIEFKIIADHIRTLVFAIADGAMFDNLGRGYVLRRLLRRAYRMGHKLGIEGSFMYSLVNVVVENYKEIYPYLEEKKESIKKLILEEENLFQKTLLSGEKKLENIFLNSTNKVISGEDTFKLYDTYGFPIELTMEYAEEKGFEVDIDGFNKYMNIQKELARNNQSKTSTMQVQNELLAGYKEKDNFVGYDTEEIDTTIKNIIKNNEFVSSSDEDCYIFLEDNPFYATSGGQVNDTGVIQGENYSLEVIDVIKCPNKQHLIHVKVNKALIKVGDKVHAIVDKEKRFKTQCNHSSIHLIQKTLQDMLGNDVHQAGSRVDENTFRFDFIYHGKITDDVIINLEDNVNSKLKQEVDTKVTYMSLDEARKLGAMALFEDKYGDVVRVVQILDSIELCGGTHIKNTKDIKKICILSIESKGSNVYRIEGTTNDNIKAMLDNYIKPYKEEVNKLLDKSNKLITKANQEKIDLIFKYKEKNIELNSYKAIIEYKLEIENLKDKIKELDKNYNELKVQRDSADLSKFKESLEVINGNNIIIMKVNNYGIDSLKQIIDNLINEYDNLFILLANINNNNINFIAKSKNTSINCGDIIKNISLSCHGNGGGNPSFGQGGGSDATNIEEYLEDLKKSLK